MISTNIGSQSTASFGIDKIRITGLTKLFRTGHTSVTALAEVNLNIPEGQFVCVVGPSGCGKTTMLRIVAGLDTATTGQVVVSQRDKSKPINSMIFQEHSIFPWMTVRDNVGYGLRMRGVRGREARDRADEYVRKVGLGRFAGAFPHQLSGGMKQRVSIARAFANDPEILLMDEPFAALDEQTKILLQEELLRIWEGTRTTVVYVTHSIDEAIVMGDRILIFTAHPGHLKTEVLIDFPRPRGVYELKANPKFGEVAFHIWGILKDEVLKAKEQERLASEEPSREEKGVMSGGRPSV
ncbi:MAG: ABC transporter ATP-binding protein [Dehalococcoidia bacterium]|nr:ABC transporter ATP-binding protein [Dehalococcoidia bacterium]